MKHASSTMNVIAFTLFAFVAYAAPVIVKAHAYDQMLIVHAEAIPKDVNKFVQAEYDARHKHPHPIRKPKVHHA